MKYEIDFFLNTTTTKLHYLHAENTEEILSGKHNMVSTV